MIAGDPSDSVWVDLPAGVLVRPLATRDLGTGRELDLYDPAWGVHTMPLVYAHVFTILPGRAKGWGVHRLHDDRYALLRGRLEVAVYDGREDSPTYGLDARVRMSDANRQLLIIPAGVWHASRNIGDDEVLVVDMPTEPYDHANPDKWTLSLDTSELPVSLGPGWIGF